MGTNLQAQAFLHRLSENTSAITFRICGKKNYNFCFLNSGRALVNRAGRKPVRAGRSALINMPSWNTVINTIMYATVKISTIIYNVTVVGGVARRSQ